jgi:WXG100 family type VII secretion target
MDAPVIQVKYDELEAVISRLRNQIAQTQAMKSALRGSYQPLQQGGWLGAGSQAFIREMDQIVFPAVDRLENALQQAEASTREIITIMRAAEEEASRPFKGGPTADGEGSSDNPPRIRAGGISDDTIDLLRRLAKETANENAQSARDPHSLFTNKYMTEMIGRTWQGEGTRELKNAMNAISNPNASDAEVKSALDTIAQVRGIDRAELDRQYEMFKELRAKVGPVEQINPFFNGDYMGTRDQLRFGQIVGDATGLDAIFGALLNPTGGMPGSGDLAIPADGSAIAYHSAFHDAGGFLYNHLQIGPGYNYLGLEHRSTEHFLTGQESGLRYWNSKIDDGIFTRTISNVFGSGSGFVVDHQVLERYENAQQTATAVYDTTLQVAEASYNTTKNVAEGVYNTTKNAAESVYNTVQDSVQDAARKIEDNYNSVKDMAFSWIPGRG